MEDTLVNFFLIDIFILGGVFGPELDGDVPCNIAEHNIKRRVRVFKHESNHMQSTPMFTAEHWQIQMETIGMFRSNMMLWTRCTNDPYHRWTTDRPDWIGHNAKDMVVEAQRQGFEVDLIYPHERYHTVKSYADNFTYKKINASDVEDEDEIRI